MRGDADAGRQGSRARAREQHSSRVAADHTFALCNRDRTGSCSRSRKMEEDQKEKWPRARPCKLHLYRCHTVLLITTVVLQYSSTVLEAPLVL